MLKILLPTRMRKRIYIIKDKIIASAVLAIYIASVKFRGLANKLKLLKIHLLMKNILNILFLI